MHINSRKTYLNQNVTVAVSTYGNYKATKKALDAIFFSTEGNFQLILVNDCSPDNTLDLFIQTKQYHGNTIVISFDQNLEYSTSLDTIFSHTRGEYVFLVSRKVLDKIGTIDPFFYGYFADHDRNINFEYLPAQLRNQKIQLRWIRVFENWARFKLKYDLSVSLLYSSINDIPWDSLNQKQFCYSKYIVK